MKNIFKLHSIAYQKYKFTLDEMEGFKDALNHFIDSINAHDSSEEHNKNIANAFLKETLYKDSRYKINTHDRIDAGIIDNSKLKVIIEYKATKNSSQMITVDNLNKIALAEAMLYYIREKHSGNDAITNIIISNSFEWFVFDSSEFRRLFYDNPRIKRVFDAKEIKKSTDDNSTQSIYKEFMKINNEEKLLDGIKYSYFDLTTIKTNREYQNLYKLLSPTNLLKLSFANDANTLNKKFYHELLHIIGLEETKVKSQKLIGRKSVEHRERGSLLENTILKLQSEFGLEDEEELFDTALELNITWLNRILFLKLLEDKLIQVDPNSKKFLMYGDPIEDFDALNTLFFEVLAKPLDDRASVMIEEIKSIPYLNSSLFEVSALERKYLRISNLKDNLTLSIKAQSNLKNDTKYQSNDTIHTLEYLLVFLDTYDFGSGVARDKEDSRKDLINSAVLGLIFEKLNGYKDGSFFTPSFITEYMSRESIRKSVVDKISSNLNISFDNFQELQTYAQAYFFKEDFRESVNSAIDSITICDPAVGSGHFLVSALNELLYIKSELGVLLSGYALEIENDELYVMERSSGEIINYTLADHRSHAIQKILFEQKRKIIENQLFGVDINPKSTQITRLRLWIELLKSSYYDDKGELTTLPNIDINIKTGNSLISKFDPQAKDSETKLPKKLIAQYKQAVRGYKQTDNKNNKATILDTISKIKKSFTQELKEGNPELDKFKKLLNGYTPKKGKIIKGYIPQYGFKGLQEEIITNYGSKEHFLFYTRFGKEYDPVADSSLFGEALELTPQQRKQQAKAQKTELQALLTQYDKIKELQSNEIYQNSFEWRFEFPEILNEEGEFVGFDIVIGNPPYIKEHTNKKAFDGLRETPYYQGKMDLWYFFGCIAIDLVKENGLINFIATNNWNTNDGASKFRNKILHDTKFLKYIDFGDYKVFEEADIQTMIYLIKKSKINDVYSLDYSKIMNKKISTHQIFNFLNKFKSPDFKFFTSQIIKNEMIDSNIVFLDEIISSLIKKIEHNKNFELNGKNEIFSGIDFPQDIVNKKSQQVLGDNINVGDGIFVISEDEKNALNLTDLELSLIKPYFTTNELDRYYGNKKNKLWVIYTDSSYKDPLSMENYPNLKKHLDKFIPVITSVNKPYGLHRAREIENFQKVKIISKRKCPNRPVFTYTDFDTFFNRTFMIVKSERINLKYLTALFNSQLVAFWLKYKGKMQGDNYQVDKEPILSTPIKKIDNPEPFEILVDKILELKEENQDTTQLEKEIDSMVYKLYGLSEDEIAIVEGEV